ncbi:MAG: DUF2085 domain-containing protein [Pyrinomonadaceae bacterium]
MGNAEDYIPIARAAWTRGQALAVWRITVGLVLLWVAAIVAVPAAREMGFGFGDGLNTFFSYICHQIPERSFYLGSYPFAVCSRCFGVYSGLLAGLLSYPLFRRIEDTDPLPRRWLFLSLVPIGIDWSLNIFGIWENTHFTRVVTGAILGSACAVYIVPALVEIRQNLALRRRSAG